MGLALNCCGDGSNVPQLNREAARMPSNDTPWSDTVPRSEARYMLLWDRAESERDELWSLVSELAEQLVDEPGTTTPTGELVAVALDCARLLRDAERLDQTAQRFAAAARSVREGRSP